MSISRILKQHAVTIPAAGSDEAPKQFSCETCGATFVWLDSWGNVHCDRCEPPPDPALVVEWIGQPSILAGRKCYRCGAAALVTKPVSYWLDQVVCGQCRAFHGHVDDIWDHEPTPEEYERDFGWLRELEPSHDAGTFSEEVTCPRCRGHRYRDVSITFGRVRRDCCDCDATIAFPTWWNHLCTKCRERKPHAPGETCEGWVVRTQPD